MLRNSALLEENDPLAETENPNNIRNDDVVLLLTAEQNLMQFLRWALSELYPYEWKLPDESDNGTNYYHSGKLGWDKLSLLGRLEPPLLVQEPHYVQVRRKFDRSDDYKRGEWVNQLNENALHN